MLPHTFSLRAMKGKPLMLPLPPAASPTYGGKLTWSMEEETMHASLLKKPSLNPEMILTPIFAC